MGQVMNHSATGVQTSLKITVVYFAAVSVTKQEKWSNNVDTPSSFKVAKN
jgi:hypothetical protein